MDTLSFKRLIGITDPEMMGSYNEFILAEVIINDRPLFDVIDDYEPRLGSGYNYNIAKILYKELICAPEAYDSCDGWPGKKCMVLLVCDCCYEELDQPLLATFEETDTEVIWRGFFADRTTENREVDYASNLPAEFHFDKEQYKAALAQLKAIADEGVRVGGI